MSVRLGDLLVRRGVLSENQRDQILLAQQECGRPFGVLAEEMFAVGPRDVEQAWAEQFACFADWVNPLGREIPASLLALLDRRQAWQFGILPHRDEGDEIVLCTAQRTLARAMRFAGWRIARPCRFVLCSEEALGLALQHFYPMEGVDPAEITALASTLAEGA